MKIKNIQELQALLDTPKSIVIIPHTNPDGDAIGSSLGWMHFLQQHSHHVEVISPNQYPDFLKWVSGSSAVSIFEENPTHAKALIERADLIFTLDFNTLKRIGEMGVEVSKSTAKKIGFLTYDKEPPSLIGGREPALDELTSLSLEKISALGKPFFMMVEGSQIDWGGHDNDASYVISEFKEFNAAIRKVLEFAKADGNTLVIVTADHETGGMAISGGTIEKGRIKAKFTTGGHSAAMVPVFSYGPNSNVFSGIYENTAIFDKMQATVTRK